MNVHLTPELETLVHNKLETGRYGSASDVVQEALHLMEELDLRRAEIRQMIAEGIEDQRAGRLVDGETVLDRIDAEIDAIDD